MRGDLTQAAVLLLAPIAGNVVVGDGVKATIDFVDVDGAQPLRQAVVLGLQAANRCVVLLALVLKAGMQPFDDPLVHLLIEAQAREEPRELLGNGFLAHISVGAFLLIAGAVVVNILALLHFADHRATAMTAGHQAGEGKTARTAASLTVTPILKPKLYALPEVIRNNRLVPALNHAAIPLVLAGVKPVAKNVVYLGDAHGTAGDARDKPLGARHLPKLPNRIVAGDIPFKKLPDDWSTRRIDLDDLLAFGATGVEIAHRRAGRPKPLLSFLGHTLARFLGQVIDVVLRHHDLNGVHELFRRTRVSRYDCAFFNEVKLHLEFIERDPIPEITVETIGFLDQDRFDIAMFLEVADHFLEIRAATLLRRLDIDEFRHDYDAVRLGVARHEPLLGFDREAFFFLLLGRDARIGDSLPRCGAGIDPSCFVSSCHVATPQFSLLNQAAWRHATIKLIRCRNDLPVFALIGLTAIMLRNCA